MPGYTMARALRGLSGAALTVAAAISLGACDTASLVEVTDPNSLATGDLNNPASTSGLVNGALAQFIGGYSGFGGDAFLSASAVITDEFYYGDTFTTRAAADSRTLQPAALGNISDAAFTRLLRARLNARRAAAQVTRFSTNATAQADSGTRALMRSIEGYVFVTVSEGWCSGAAFSSLPDSGSLDPNAIAYGGPLTTAQMNDSAVIKFNEALTFNPTNNLAKIGKARALLNNGQYAAAAAAVATVPTTYVFLLEHSSNSGNQNNPIYALQANGRYGVANLEGGLDSTGAALRTDRVNDLTAPSAEGIPFRGLQDPRVPSELKSPSTCFSSAIRCYVNDNYPSNDADVPLASGVEARLIEAEAALKAGDTTTMYARLDMLRSLATTLIPRLYPNRKEAFFVNGAPKMLGALVRPAEADSISLRTLFFRERALWLYNTGHRQGDLRRLVRNYGLPSNTVFPSGPFFRGGTYGNDVAYPLPVDELQNPKYDPAGCVTTKA